MSPFLDREIHLGEGEEAKFVRVGNNIFYEKQNHKWPYLHRSLAPRAGAPIKHGRYDIADAGIITFRRGKYHFLGLSTSFPVLDAEGARKTTVDLAINILGEIVSH